MSERLPVPEPPPDPVHCCGRRPKPRWYRDVGVPPESYCELTCTICGATDDGVTFREAVANWNRNAIRRAARKEKE